MAHLENTPNDTKSLHQYRTQNNKYPDCPARMDDGRNFTDYRSSRDVDNTIRFKTQIFNTHDYRTYLTHNAEKIMCLDRTMACQKNCSFACSTKKEDPSHEAQEIQQCDAETCRRETHQLAGLGVERHNPADDELSSYFDHSASKQMSHHR